MITRRAALSGLLPALLCGQNQKRPHVLFIAADDMNTALGCYGHPIVKTPNIDRIARLGVRFDRAYCQYPLCGPSRASLMSGLRPDTTRIQENQIAVRDTMPDVVTLPQLFRQNGWHSARAGKMYHMDVPASVGTNKWDDPPSWDVAYSPPGKEQNTEGEVHNMPAGKSAWRWISFSGDGKDQADDRAAETAIETFRKITHKPIFMGLGFLRPHLPHVAPARFYDLYPMSQIQAIVNPANDRDDIPKASEITINTRANDMGMSELERRQAIRSYYASISYMDWQVGRVLDAIESQGLLSKTIIVFWGDHGWHLGEHHRWHKRSLFEESAKAPLIIAAPGEPGNGGATNAMVEFVDIYPTLADLAGLRAPAGLEGQSLRPLLRNPARPFKKAAFTQVTAPGGIIGRSVVNSRYRYIRWEGPHPDEELYDHSSDPREFVNLARTKDHPALPVMRQLLNSGWMDARA